jgi:hypothetical protein
MAAPQDPLWLLDNARRDSARRSAERLTKGNEEASRLVTGLFDRLAETQLEIRDLHNAKALDHKTVREVIFGLSEIKPDVPIWAINPPKAKHSPGVPTLFASDWHWGEVVDPEQINGVNKYNLRIAHARAKRLVERSIDLLKNHMVNPSYPGIVFPLGGDMVSGDIHDELRESNELATIPTVLDLLGVLCACVKSLADAFGHVHLPCVTGNHGRNTLKIRAKGRVHTSYDWLLYCLLEREFKDDRRVTFQVANGPDVSYSIYGHRYLLTHGDQFRGGDGLIGMLGPVIRGDHKKRGRNGQIGLEYDTMLLGHWHQYVSMNRIIVNGSLKGYDEYANSGNFGFEKPKQALFMTHPKHGITFSMPVVLEDQPVSSMKWVDWPGKK